MISLGWRAGVVEMLLGPARMVGIERLLAYSCICIGLWALTPWWSPLVSGTLLAEIPVWAVCTVLVLHGSLYVWALEPPEKMGLCRRAALATAAMFLGVTGTFVAMPPDNMYVVVTPACMGTAGLFINLRLGLLFK